MSSITGTFVYVTISWRHLSISATSQLLPNQFWPNFKGRFLGPSLPDAICQFNIFLDNICPDDICTKLFRTQFCGVQNSIWLKFCQTQTFFNPNCFWPKFFWTQNLFEPKIFLTQKSFGQKSFETKFTGAKILFDRNILDPSFFWQIFLDPKIFMTNKFFWTHLFLDWNSSHTKMLWPKIQNIINPNFFLLEIVLDATFLWTQNIFLIQKFFLNPHFIWTNNFFYPHFIGFVRHFLC